MRKHRGLFHFSPSVFPQELFLFLTALALFLTLLARSMADHPWPFRGACLFQLRLIVFAVMRTAGAAAMRLHLPWLVRAALVDLMRRSHIGAHGVQMRRGNDALRRLRAKPARHGFTAARHRHQLGKFFAAMAAAIIVERHRQPPGNKTAGGATSTPACEPVRFIGGRFTCDPSSKTPEYPARRPRRVSVLPCSD